MLTLAQARRAGLSHEAVRRRLQSGHWRRCARGVYFVDDRPFTDGARIRAAVWSYGQHAAASGLAAAWWHGLTKFAPDVAEVTVPRNSHGRRRDGCRVRRRDLASSDIVVHQRLRVTALHLTVVEAAVRRRDGAKLMDAALQNHVDLRDLWRAHLRNKGRYGSPRARRLLQAASSGARSEAERLLVKLLRAAGITGWNGQLPCRSLQDRRCVSGAQDCNRDRWLGIPQRPRRVSARSKAPELFDPAGLAGPAVYLARPRRVSTTRHRRNPRRDLGALIGR